MKTKKTNAESVERRIESGEIVEQKSWQMIKELNSFSDERLDSIALINGKRSYTYRQMFRHWELYAEVFSSLGITEKNKSRVGLVAGLSVECVLSIYALNMMGVSVTMLDDLFNAGSAEDNKKVIEKEGITDLLLTSERYTADNLKKFVSHKRDFGINNIIVDCPATCGPISTPELRNAYRRWLRDLKAVRGVLFMDDLLKKYEAYPIAYGSGKQDDAAVIVHTSGTTGGVRKPVPLSDAALNESVLRILKDESFSPLRSRAVSWLMLPPSSAYGLTDMVHLPLAFGGCIVSIPKPFRNPLALKTIPQYKVNVFFMPNGVPEMLEKLPLRPDLSSLELAVIGGAFVSDDRRRSFKKYLRKCGSDAKLIVGYGLSEAGAACFLSTSGKGIGSIGYPLPGVSVMLYSEEDERFYSIDDGPHTGVLYIASRSLSSGKLGRTRLFELETIDGVKYYNTNDVVRLHEDGSFSFVGRANRFFVNNDGVRFDAGLVETAVGDQPGIIACGLVPDFSKVIQDTVPVLYIETADPEASGKDIVHQALVNVFIHDDEIRKTNLPSQCVICKELPRNAAGKVDISRIRSEGADGIRYTVIPVRKDRQLRDIRLQKIREHEILALANIADHHAIPEELENFFRYEDFLKP